jgi:hypothetical protein
MSLGIALKGPEGIVLSADSRVTLMNQVQPAGGGPQILLPASFDNATKLLRAKGQDNVAAVTYGVGAIGIAQPRTAHSFLPEFEKELAGGVRLGVKEFAARLGDFFTRQWKSANMPATVGPGDDMVFLVGGYDENEAYGTVFEVHVPTNPIPVEKIPTGQFGIVWGGQKGITDRIIQGFDGAALGVVYDLLGTPPQLRTPNIENQLRAAVGLKIPIQFLPLQDCVDLSIFLIRATILLQRWIIDVRGVGGAVDVATITRTDGFKPIQLKQIVGEKIL